MDAPAPLALEGGPGICFLSGNWNVGERLVKGLTVLTGHAAARDASFIIAKASPELFTPCFDVLAIHMVYIISLGKVVVPARAWWEACFIVSNDKLTSVAYHKKLCDTKKHLFVFAKSLRRLQPGVYNAFAHVAHASGSKWDVSEVEDAQKTPTDASLCKTMAEVRTWILNTRKVHNYKTTTVFHATCRNLI